MMQKFMKTAVSIKFLIFFMVMGCFSDPQNPNNLNPKSIAQMDILEATKSNNVEQVTSWIENKRNVNKQDTDGNTPLHYATYNQNLVIAKLLVEAGANVNTQNNNVDSPFLFAGAEGMTEFVKLYLSHGADFSVYNRYNGTALIPACEKGHVATVRLLANTPNFPINHINRLGWTALMETVILSDGSKNYQEIIKILLKAGADKNIPDKDGTTALEHAEQRNFKAIVNLLK
ncbi:ankyrin repeat domain-containing protein [uncultured Weeksella sp.]|uniref:ankyrin repeat domain-containing protein n=1 Tax=uncultured Weeksella sp. TaxID=1161389 RepID=UPI00259B9F39|nr:ankyrin repeat domain-containing protein [uncultured Weeksella sp.]